MHEDRNLRSLILLMIVSLLGTFSFRLSVPVVAFYARLVLEASAISIGALMSMFFAFRAVGSLIAGHRYCREAMYIAATCFAVAATLIPLYGIANSAALLLLLRAIHGFLLGFAWTTIQVTVGFAAPAKFRGTIYAIYFAVGSLALPLADYVYSLLAYTPREIPLLLASALMITTSGLVFYAKLPDVQEKPRTRSITQVGAPLILLVFFVFLTRLVSAFTMGDIVYVILKEWLRLTRSAVAQLLATFSGIGVGVSLPLNFLADRVSDKAAIVIVGVLISLGLVLFGLGIGYYCLGLALLIVGARCLVPLSRRLAMMQKGARGVGYVSAAGNLGTVLSSLVAGALYDIAKQAPTLITTLTFVAAIMTLLVSTLLTIKIEEREQ